MPEANDITADLEAPVEAPVIVPASAVPEQFKSLLRAALIGLAGYLLAKGLISEQARTVLLSPEVINWLAPVILGLIGTGLAQLKTLRNNAVQKTLANKLPDAEARVE